MSNNQDADRRNFLSAISAAVSGAIALVAAIPGIGALVHPLVDDTVRVGLDESLLGKVSDFTLGKPKRVMITAHKQDGWITTPDDSVGSVWVVKEEAGFRVLSSICPHRGCPIGASDSGFVCPCHTSYFDIKGTRLEDKEPSPSPRDMDVLEHSVRDGQLYCQYQRFESGTEEKKVV